MSASDHTHSPNGDQDDLVPGLPEKGRTVGIAMRGYAIGLVLATLLTVASFALPATDFIWRPALPIALVVLAVAQMGIHLVFFLHMTTAPDNTNNVLALAFGILIVLIVLSGSLWIMASLNSHMIMDHNANTGMSPAMHMERPAGP